MCVWVVKVLVFLCFTFLLVSHQCFFSLLVRLGEVTAIVALLVIAFVEEKDEEEEEEEWTPSLSFFSDGKYQILLFALTKEREISRGKKKKRERGKWNFGREKWGSEEDRRERERRMRDLKCVWKIFKCNK